MTTEWGHRIYFFIRALDATLANKTSIAQIYVDHGSGETLENEMKMFDNPVKLSTTGILPAQAFGFSIPAKLAMRDALKTFLQTLTNARYAAVEHDTNALVLTNWPGVTPTGQVITWEAAVAKMLEEFGLKIIPEVVPPI